ncbi:salt stress protein, Slr1339 family [Geminocystis sp. CENA526]|uniref:salt stress protein, Slr1339 family n=1 Tax=Geminocystis sp. CENA526 TaxID=1355871 RepID=UPI003D6F4F74
MDNIDNFITQIEQKYHRSNPVNQSVNHGDNKVNNNDIDSFLSNLQSEKSTNKTPSNKDDLLAEIETKFKDTKVRSQSSTARSNSKQSKSEDLLTEIESKFIQQKPQNKKETSPDLLADIENQFKQNKTSSKPAQKSNLAEQKLDEIAESFSKKQSEIKLHSKTENLEEIRQKELEKQRQEKQLIRKAELWLKNLDPYSDEGFWFEQFALSYNTKLEAAIDYLRALQ